MQDKKKTKVASGDKKKTRQQGKVAAPKQVKEIQRSRTQVKRQTSSNTRNTRRTNAPIHAENPRRVQRHSKFYTFLIAAILIILGAALFLLLFTYTSADMAADVDHYLNIFGYIGAHIADIMLTLFGLSAFFFSAVCILLGLFTISGKQLEVKPGMLIGLITLIVGASPLFYMMFGESQVLEHSAGGVLGSSLSALALNYISSSILIAVCLVLCLLGLIYVTDTGIKAFFVGLFGLIKKIFTVLFNAQVRCASTAVDFDEPAPIPASKEEEQEQIPNDDSSIFDEETPSELLGDSSKKDPETSTINQNANISDVQEDSIPDESVQPEDVSDNNLNLSEEIIDDSEELPEDDSIDEIPEPEPEPETKAEPIPDPRTIAKEPKPEKTDGGDAFGDLMARILNRKKTPKSRPVRRNHSVPALEPEFDFDSIVAPEQIGNVQKQQSTVAEDLGKTGVLGNWKPRPIGRKTMHHSDLPAADVPQEPITRPALVRDEIAESPKANDAPANLTKDLLAQLDSGEIDDFGSNSGSANDAATKCKPEASPNDEATKCKPEASPNDVATKCKPEASPNDVATKYKQPERKIEIQKPSSQMTKVGQDSGVIRQLADMMTADSEEIQSLSDKSFFIDENSQEIGQDTLDKILSAKISQHDNHLTPAPRNIVYAGEKTAVPVSSELRSLMSEANPALKPRIQFDDFDDSDDSMPMVAPRRNDAPTNPRDPRNSFVVAEEKKRASNAELDEADKARLKRMGEESTYHHPPLSLLHYDPATNKGFDMESLKSYANKIEEKLAEYHVMGQVVEICPGPVITRFEYQPAPGTKVSKISGLSDDLMMALEITSIRIQAPVPGKNVVGIEIPNEKRNTIYLKEVLGSKQFMEAKSILTIGLGKDSEGEPVVSDLAKMPHLLVAGSTGSGKSVAINTMICSLLYNARPDEVKFILVDPKCLELSVYEGIPHLLVPPITTPKETASALEWACEEMDNRYRLLASFGVRNIAGYNEQVKKPTLEKAIERMAERDENGECPYKHMPYIVIVVDEFADLMMVSGKEIETAIARLAQKARAAGIHIILATQRPSANVITGVIKANFPTRIAFRVFSVVDSKVILDNKGAESLLGNGDSLFLPPNSGILQRVHGAYVSDDEVQEIVKFLSAQGAPEYNLDITAPRDDSGCDDMPSADERQDDRFDDMYDQAVRLVAETRQASASFLQRRLGIGFPRAARIIEQMEREGVIGPQKGQKQREVLIGPI